ncbi:hypothetical protein PAGA_a3659 [Pseudoalteromonas agarivorans DSM 14585]|uniref:Uncharacterized protein n=1 Tax=Pseudoalteromonas agarivorans DSM 14585 TaxID=1312369 RepID=A0ACA8E0Q8_9GAMM|nr:hypothetical protein PAGA_a3659 [Pseudoalteromonas agarivorans DSM 14585]
MQFSHLHSDKLSYTLLQTPIKNIATLKPNSVAAHFTYRKQFSLFT